MPTDTELLLRAINAPPILGRLSAARSTPYLSPGIGVGPGNQMVPKSEQEIAQAVAAWRQIADANPPNRWANTVFGDTPGQAQGNLLNLRAQNIQAAQENARREQSARLAAMESQRIRDAQAAESARLREFGLARLAQEGALERDAITARQQGDLLDYLASLERSAGTRMAADARTAAAQDTLGQLAKLRALAPMFDQRESELEAERSAIVADALNKARAWYDGADFGDFAGSFGIAVDSDTGLPTLDIAQTFAGGDPRPYMRAFESQVPINRDRLNQIELERQALARGRDTYASDLAMAAKGVPVSGLPAPRSVAPMSAPATQYPDLPLADAARMLLARSQPVVMPRTMTEAERLLARARAAEATPSTAYPWATRRQAVSAWPTPTIAQLFVPE